ncbi:MAG: Ni/Fe hydrogenase subunit alpha [Pseudomonadota bacterium]
MKRITIDPVTRLEGHGKIEIFLDDKGDVANAYFQVPELRGFEKFAEGRPVEEMPRITSRICGVCPEAHLMASAKACDAVYGIDIPETAKKLRELQYSAFFLGDHTTHFYALAGPDFVCGPDAPKAERNIIGVIKKVGLEVGGKVIKTRRECHEIAAILGGKPVNPINALPGGVSKGLSKEERTRIAQIATDGVEFAKFTLKVFEDIVLKNKAYVDLILSDPYTFPTYYMGLVDGNNKVNFYDGKVRVVGPDGVEHCKYAPDDYREYVAEHVEPWTYLKFPYLKKIGCKGFVSGKDSGVYQATPLARLNAADGMTTPLAQAEYDKMYKTLGGKPVKHNLAMHWARVIELMYAAERLVELVKDDGIMGADYRALPTKTPSEGVGIVEAPRGTLTHHYWTDENGIVTKANLIVGTTNNHAPICMSIKKAAQGVIKAGKPVTDALLNMVEMSFRSYDPCYGCATHSLPGQMPLEVVVYDSDRNVVQKLTR